MSQKNKYAVILHLYYTELWEEIRTYLSNLESFGFDLYVTVTDKTAIDLVKSAFPNAFVTLVENRGRDILPFITVLNFITSKHYEVICKVHSKLSPHCSYGHQWRREMFDALLGAPEKIANILKRFSENETLGLIGPQNKFHHHSFGSSSIDFNNIQMLSNMMDIEFEDGYFFAGTMFWFRGDVLEPILKIDTSLIRPESEGIILLFAIERIFSSIAASLGYTTETC